MSAFKAYSWIANLAIAPGTPLTPMGHERVSSQANLLLRQTEDNT
jgi:hypothetical protein